MSHPYRYVAAAIVGVPVGTIVWLELLYLIFGITGEDATPLINIVALIAAFGLAVGWPLYHTYRPAEVMKRSCGLGVIVALLLPIIVVAVLFLVETLGWGQGLGMGGLIFYGLPVVAFVVAVVLVTVFGFGSWLAGRQVRRSG